MDGTQLKSYRLETYRIRLNSLSSIECASFQAERTEIDGSSFSTGRLDFSKVPVFHIFLNKRAGGPELCVLTYFDVQSQNLWLDKWVL